MKETAGDQQAREHGSPKTARNLRARINFNRVINAAHRRGKIWIEHAIRERERERERAALKIIFQFDCSDISSHPSSSLPSPTRSSQETPNRIHIFRPAPPSASATLEKGSSKIQTFLRAILLDRRITDN